MGRCFSINVSCNCLSKVNYNETRVLVIKQYVNRLEFSNPGAFTMRKELAFVGGNSDARNKLILTMFNNINIGERTGSGIPLIISATKDEGYTTPTFQDFFNHDYTLVTIYLKSVVASKHNLEINNDNLNIEDNNLNIENDNLNIENDNLNIDKCEDAFSQIINSLVARNDIKEKLFEIRNKFKNDIFGSSAIVELLKCGRTSSDNYIKILLANKLIEPVKGYGKGKYRFK